MNNSKFKNLRALRLIFFIGIVTIKEDTRGFIRNNFNQQFIIWPCKYNPQTIIRLILDQALAYVQSQDRGKNDE